MSARLSPHEIKSRLGHPVIDADGHWIEYGPLFHEQLRKVGGDLAVEGFAGAADGTADVLSMTVEERRRRRISQEAFWQHPSATPAIAPPRCSRRCCRSHPEEHVSFWSTPAVSGIRGGRAWRPGS